MSYTEKIDVLDLIIEILREQERSLDLLVSRLEAVADRLDPQGKNTPQQDLEGYLDDRWRENL